MPDMSLRNSPRPAPNFSLWQRTLRAFGWTSTVPVDKLRKMCLDVIDDVPLWYKQGLVSRISCLRRRDELLEIKPHLFSAVSQHYGEREARSRIDWLDSQLP